MKVWSVILWLVAAMWLAEAVILWFGYEPTKFSICVAFVITAGAVAEWASEAWRKDK